MPVERDCDFAEGGIFREAVARGEVYGGEDQASEHDWSADYNAVNVAPISERLRFAWMRINAPNPRTRPGRKQRA